MRKVFGAITCLALGLCIAGCTPGNGVVGAVQEDAEEVVIPVETSQPTRRDVAEYFETTSRVEAERRVEVVSKGTGECNSVLVEEGDVVEAGQVLAELDKAELEAQIRQTRVSLEQNEYQRAKAEEQLKEGLISPYEAENARFLCEQARATLEMQEVQLAHQTIRAPIGGVVTQRNVQVGMVVSTGLPVFSIVDPSSFMLPIQVPEKDLGRLEEGQKALVRVDSRPDEELAARVRRINPSVDPMSGTVKVTLDFEEADRDLLSEAAFARIRLILDTHENALVIPKDAVLEENARHYVMIVQEEEPEGEEPAEETTDREAAESAEARLVARRVEVETGLEDPEYVEIVSGIDEDTRVVTLGQHTLKAGSPVKITNAADEIEARKDMTVAEALAASKAKKDGRDVDAHVSGAQRHR